MASWTDLAAAFGFGTKLTSQQMQQLRDNITALAEGASGAPDIVLPPESAGSNDYFAGGKLGAEVMATNNESFVDMVNINFPMGGEFRFYTEYSSEGGSSTAHIKILQNGGEYAAFSTGSGSYQNRTDDITVEPGDQIKFQARTGNAAVEARLKVTLRGTNYKGIFTYG